MSSTSLGPHSLAVPLDDPWDLAHFGPLNSAAPPNADGGILSSPTMRGEPVSQEPSAWSLSATPFGANAGILAPLAQPNSRFEESFPAWLQSVLPFDGNAPSSVAAAQLTEQPKENSLFRQPTPVTQSDWSTLPIPSAPAATFLPLPMPGTPDKDDPWLAASHPNLRLNLSPMQPIPDFLKGSRGVPLNPPTLLSEFPTPQPPEHNARRSHLLFEADRGPLGTSAWRDDYQPALDPLRVTISQNQWEASPSTNLSPSPRAANSQGVPDLSSIQPPLSDADPPTWTPGARYAQNTPRRGAPGLSRREPSSEESIRLLLYHHARRLLGEMDPRNPELRSISTSTWIPENRDLHRINSQIARLKRGRSSDLERHHTFPLEFEAKFRACGINPEDYVLPVARAEHRLRPDGIHTGSDHWNSQWRRFLKEHDRPTPEQFFGQLNMMLKRIPWLQP